MIRSCLRVIALLVLLNVGILLWPDSANYAPHVYNAKQQVSTHFIRFNKEIEGRFHNKIEANATVIKPAPAVSTEVLPVEHVDVAEAVLVNEVAAQLDEVVESDECYRVGPFAYLSNYELAQAVLFNMAVEFEKTRKQGIQQRVFRVYLGPYDDLSDAKSARNKLKRKKITEHFIRKQDDQYIVSLGVFSNQVRADRAVQSFKAKSMVVKKKEELAAAPESRWLKISVAKEGRIQEQLSASNWGEESVKVVKSSCDQDV